MALQFYLGCSGSGKSYQLYKHIIDESLVHPELTYLILVPEQYNLTTQQQIISMHPKKGILNIDVLSFSRLAHRVFEEVGYSRAKGKTLDDIGKNLILRHMASGNEDKLTALSGIFSKLGYISEVKSVISEFMQYGIGTNELSNMIAMSEGKGILKAKLTDIKYLYEEFLKYINGKYITTEEILQKVRDAVPASKKLKKSIIVLDGYTGFTPVQLQLIQALLENCVDVYLTLLLDVRNGIESTVNEQDIFYMSYKTKAALEKLCADYGIDKKPDVMIKEEIPARFLYDRDGRSIEESGRSHDLIRLERELFRTGEKADGGKLSGRGDTGGNIRIFTGTDPDDEAMEAAVRIERLIREHGYHYRDIAVVSGDISTYMNACSRAFSKYDIPFFIDKTVPVLLNPMIEYIRAVFDVITDDLSYGSMFRYLRSMPGGFEKDDVDLLENYVLKYGIKGRKRWNTGFVRKPKGMTVDELALINILRERAVESINIFLEELTDGKEDVLKDKNAAFDVRLISTALYHYMKRAGLQERMEELGRTFEERGDAVRAREYAGIYEEVCVLLDKMVNFLPDEILTLKEYAELLDAGFAEIRTGVIPESDDHVQIGDITRTRLRNIKALFFMGVNDGIIPLSSGKGGILSDMEREFLLDNDSGIEMAPGLREQAYTQRLYLYMLVTKPSERLYISYAGMDKEGESLNPSYFVKTVRHLFPEVKTEHPDESINNRVYGSRTGYEMLASSLQEAVREEGGITKADFLSLFKIYTDNEEYREKIGYLLKGAFSEGVFSRKDKISRAVADALYGRELTCSITRLETYAKCAYSHFLKYGLSLKEREQFSFEAKDMGSVFHDTLQYYAGILKERKLSWFDLGAKDREPLIEEAIQRCIGSEDYEALYGSFRTKYMINRMKRITTRTVDTLTEQLKKGSFIPQDFEFSFSSANDYTSLNIALSDDEKLHLMGRIDRVDVCEQGDKVYVKVIDYKSGNKSFDLAAVYMGLDLQLVVYLNAALEYISKKYGDQETVIPAGIFYYHIDDPMINADGSDPMTDEEINEKILGELRMSGLVNSEEEVYRLMDKDFDARSSVIPVSVKKDGEFGQGSSVASTEEFKTLSDYVNQKISEMGKEILDGDIKIEPHKRSEREDPQCKYCDYAGICGYKGEGIVPEGIDSDSDDPKDDDTDS